VDSKVVAVAVARYPGRSDPSSSTPCVLAVGVRFGEYQVMVVVRI